MVNIKELLKHSIPENLQQYLPKSYDLVGSKAGQVAIIDIPTELEGYKIDIAKAILTIHKNVKSVIRRIGSRKGDFRLYDYEVLVGNETEIIHKEHGYFIKLDPTKVYFSPRDSNDRIDLASKVRPEERILYLFAGVGPYALAIAKFQPLVKIIIAIEKNPNAFYYMLENKKINHIEDKILCINDDVINVCPFFDEYADRVIMTLPLGATQYLKLAISCLRNAGGFLHYYKVLSEQDINYIRTIVEKDLAGLGNLTFDLVSCKKVGEYSPGKFKYRIDVYIKKHCR